MSKLPMLALVSGIAAVAGSAAADVTLTSQNRTASATSWTFSPGTERHDEEWAATGYGSASATLTPAGSMGTVTHQSDAHPYLIAADLYGHGTHFLQGWNGVGRALAEVGFHVDTPTPYRFYGSWAASYVSGTALVELTGPDVSIRHAPTPAGAMQSGSFSYEGVFMPGDYMVRGSTSGYGASAMFSSGTGRVNFSLEVPAPGSAGVLAAGLWMGARRRR